MKKIIKSRAIKISTHDLNLPASKSGLGHYLPQLEQTVGQMDAMLSHHSKVLVVRTDLHLYVGSDDNKPMSDFIRRLRKKLSSMGHKHFGYIWCREQNVSDVQHYHLAVMVDGNKMRHPHHLIGLIEYFWETWGHVKPYVPQNCYSLIKRGDDEAFQKVFDRLSYLAKVATKGKRKKTTNDHSTSRIKLKMVNNVMENKIKKNISNSKTRLKPKFEVNELGKIHLNQENCDTASYFKKITGIDSSGGVPKLVAQAAEVVEKPKEVTPISTSRALNHTMSLMEGVSPNDPVEGMLATQMVAIHEMTMVNARKASSNDISPEFRQQYVNNTVKLSRTFTSQIEALKKYRSKGAQKITVEHVNVEAGGQAMVGSEIHH